jgi:sulfur carrier protein ThiS
MKRNPLATAVKLALTGIVAGSLVACGGGSGSSGSGAASSGTSVGPVSGFGSVYVNGTRFETNGSVSSDDGVEREGQLEKGMIVKVSGSWGDDGQGQADRLDYDDSVRGPLQSAIWDEVAGQGTLQVAGQDIAIDAQTVFKGATPVTLADAAANTYRVRVSAWRLDDGSFRASYVGSKLIGSDFDDLNEVEIEGEIADLDAQAQTFRISGIDVDYQSAEFDDGLDSADLFNGLVIEVEGFIENGVLIAEEIDGEDDLFDDDDDVKIAGAISGDYDDSARQFQLNGITVQVNGSTELEDGLRESDLSDGLLVKVEGDFRNGVLVADEIEPRDGDAELDGKIESRNGNELVVSGVKVRLTASTLIENDDDENDDDRIVMRTQDIESLRVGDYVEIEGRERTSDGGYLEAIKIEHDDGEDRYEMEGRVTVVTSGSVTVLGLAMLGGSVDLSGFQVGDQVDVEYSRNVGGDYVVFGIEEDD